MYFDFETKIRTSDISTSKFGEFIADIPELEIEKISATIFWEVEPEIREWGIKSMIVIVKSIRLEIEYYIDEMIKEKEEAKIEKLLLQQGVYVDRYGHIKGEVAYKIDYTDEDWKINYEDFKFKDGSLSPSEMYINFSTKTIEIE